MRGAGVPWFPSEFTTTPGRIGEASVGLSDWVLGVSRQPARMAYADPPGTGDAWFTENSEAGWTSAQENML